MDFIVANSLTQRCSNEPTFINKSGSPNSKIDYIFSSSKNICMNTETINDKCLRPHYVNINNEIVFSEHLPMMFEISIKIDREQSSNTKSGNKIVFRKTKEVNDVDVEDIKNVVVVFTYDTSVSSLTNYNRWIKMIRNVRRKDL